MHWNAGQAYANYYDSGVYAARYPRCNRRSLDFVLRAVDSGHKVLDFGCGTGRYMMPILHETRAHVVGYDICPSAINSLRRLPEFSAVAERAVLVAGALEEVEAHGPFDTIIAMFGVLSHIPHRNDRVTTLVQLADLLRHTTASTLILSVPNRFRRFHLQQARHAWRIWRRQSGERPRLEHGDILYHRRLGTTVQEFFYHLFSPSSLCAELGEAGFRPVKLVPESVLPEKMVTCSRMWGILDHALSAMLPAHAGYGLLAVTKRANAQETKPLNAATG